VHDVGPRETLRRGAPGYPAALLDLSDPPDALYVRGALPDPLRAVAIVGSRASTPYGRERARVLAADLARLGWAVVSGLARGIDAAAHEGALEASGVTAAVLPAGLDVITPRSHEDLAARIAARGALVSEYDAEMWPWPGTFLRRNRLIAALASATVVVEAAERSGALSTAAATRRLGRPLLAVPGDADRPSAQGCFALIRDGARVCLGVRDVIEAIETAPRQRPRHRPRSIRGDALHPPRPVTTGPLATQAAAVTSNRDAPLPGRVLAGCFQDRVEVGDAVHRRNLLIRPAVIQEQLPASRKEGFQIR